EIDGLIPVPVSPKRYRKRGFNQAYDLAREVSVHTHVPVYDLLRRIRNTKPQSECTKAQRASNVKGSIGINSQNLQKIDKILKKVAIIDDIYTTGSTARECAKMLQQCFKGEIEQIFVLVVARGM
ncbi:MAG: ComF family protein, partial [Cellulosilyticaceae bacterium]